MTTANPSTLVAALVALGVLAPATRADEVTLTAVQDNTIYSLSITSSNALGLLSTGTTSAGNARRILMMFDVAGAVPSDSTIISAKLRLNLLQADIGAADQDHSLHLILEEWGQGTSESGSPNGGIATLDDPTWGYRFFPFDQWATFGGTMAAEASAEQIIGNTPGLYTIGSTPGMVADVQGWLEDPSANYGWVISGDEVTPLTGRVFTNLEDDDPALRPRLILVYEPPSCDLNGDAVIDAGDLALLLGAWGHDPGNPADLNDDGMIDAADLALLLGNWGPC